MTGRNLLEHEKSPYLLQHRENPVWWHPWGDEAFERARLEDKPVFLSIGYSTCYWCHVMEHDSFERSDVADVLNEHFVSIKVDREEYPDVDQLYMDVVVGIHGHGGWPMSVFLTPERKPFWGGTFFYRDQFIQILQGITHAWRTDRGKVLASGDELTRYLQSKQYKPGRRAIEDETFVRGAEQTLARYDSTHGGFGGAPKFPPTQQIQLLLRMYLVTKSAAAIEAAMGTLVAMAKGGIFDHLGGGFHRYSVDAQWHIPHFEKMLYDNALLAQVYLEATQLTGDLLCRDVAARTLDYIVREMIDERGGFHSAEDAGEVGKEGEFYAWTPSQIESVLGEERASKICELYGITGEGNFERGTSALILDRDVDWSVAEAPEIREACALLLQERAKRDRPHRDDKVLTAWNGLAISALCKGYQVLQNTRYLDAAIGAARFIREHLWGSESGLLRRYCRGHSGIEALLEDYAYLIDGVLGIFECTGDRGWLEWAEQLQDEQDGRLWSADRQSYLSSAQAGLLVRGTEWSDGVTPTPNAVSLSNLLALSEVIGESRFASRARSLEEGIPTDVGAQPLLFTSTLRAGLSRRTGLCVCVLASPEVRDEPPREAFELWSRFLPFTRVVWQAARGGRIELVEGRSATNGAVTFYVCRHHSCFEPTVDVEWAVRLCSETRVLKTM
jgi:uncharacterized protein YyaL (SSP411 family)